MITTGLKFRYVWLFQLYFYTDLFTLLPESQILNEDKLNKGTIEKLPN